MVACQRDVHVHLPAKEREAHGVHACDWHQCTGDGFVAATQGDDGVREVALVHDLDRVGDVVAGHERVPHGLGSICQAVTVVQRLYMII